MTWLLHALMDGWTDGWINRSTRMAFMSMTWAATVHCTQQFPVFQNSRATHSVKDSE